MPDDDAQTVRIRSAGPDDALALASLSLRFAGVAEPQEDAVAALAGELRQWMRTDGNAHLVALALRGEEPVGMAWLARIARPPREPGQRRLSGDIQSVFVEPAVRGLGIGRALIEHLLGGLEGRTTVHSSAAAIPFSARLGFASSETLLQRGPD